MSVDLEIIAARPRGRPSLYNPAYCERVLALAAEGCGKAEIAAAIGVNTRTLTAWTKAHEDFRNAMMQAKEIEYAWWLAAGRKGQFMRNWSAGGWALQMRNRFRKRFRDRAAPEHDDTAKEGVNADQLREEIEQKLSRLAAAGEAEGVPVEPHGERTPTPQT